MKNQVSDKSMFDLVHKCLRCDEMAYEFEFGVYKCSKCGFIWEVS